jgi:Ca2+-binding EF-hand superfamily protein
VFIRISLLAAGLALASTASAQGAPAAKQAPKQISKADFTKNLDSRFANMDTNHDGQLDKAEIAAAQAKAVQQAQAVEQQRLEAEFKKLDTNHDNQLSLAEFKAAAPSLKTNETPDQMVSQLDTNKDGKISTAEYRAPQLANFDKADTNHDGIVTAQELAAARR